MSTYPRVTEILKEAGLIDMSMVNADILERACLFGSAVHKACELKDTMKLDYESLDKALLPYLAAWVKFKEDYIVDFVGDQIEEQLISEKWKFRGTPDRWCLIGKSLTVIDIKTSTAILPSTAIQTAAYSILVEEHTGKEVKQRWCVKLEEGKYKIEPYRNSQDKTVFLSALNLWHYKKEKGLLKCS